MTARRLVPRTLARRRHALAQDRGSSAIELAILAPALIILTMLIVQWALWFQARQVALDAAQAGARVARAQQPGWPAQSVSQALGFYHQVGTSLLGGPHASVSPAGGQPNAVYVTVTGTVPTLIPLIPQLTVRETAGGDVECFRPAQLGGQQC
jgi:Flp pilus assembly protein TadG